MKFVVNITLKTGVLDPQGLAIKNSLSTLGFKNINKVKQGKLVEIDIDEDDSIIAKTTIAKMCEELLTNTVIEDYEITEK